MMKSHTSLLATIAFCAIAFACAAAHAQDISTSGWRLWPDRAAQWKNDTLYLPDEVNLAKMPVNPPTGGWTALNNKQGIPVTLPSTVEEHYWGVFGTRPYKKNEAQKGPNTTFPNGNYLGVSWWWRNIQPPALKPGQRFVVSFRSARLRAEVYCNGKLCGYTIMTELPFTADITDAFKPGQANQLAVRITNAGGGFDWLDFANMRFHWGKYVFPPSHGFGGLDADIQMYVRDDGSVTDIAAINTPDLHTVHLSADVSTVRHAYRGPVHFTIRRGNQTVWTGDAMVAVAAAKTATVDIDAHVASAKPWDLQHPNLYRATATLNSPASDKSVDFGFRYFTAKGIGGNDAKLTLNGHRIVLISAISWGYWGRNGLWPDSAMANREVNDAKELGLNCLNFHRNIGKPEVLDIQDRIGLLRIEEPGAGKMILGTRYSIGPFDHKGNYIGKGDGIDMLNPPKGWVRPEHVDTSGKGPNGDAQWFWEKYEEAKILAMVKRDRSHPSLIFYTIQNEASDMDIRNPRIYRVFREMHALDPSRIIVFYSGGYPKDGQVLMLPYSNHIQTCTKEVPFAGWRDVHTCGGPCNYMDNLYHNPKNFVTLQKLDAHKSICEWGEMLGAAVPDDYQKLLGSFDAEHPTGYEKADMTKVLNGYHQFLDKYGFRKAFPTDSSLFQAIGFREYYFWQRIIEQARADNSNDTLVISGWESTTIDDHSGLVDNHRFFKGNPKVLAAGTAPLVLYIQPRHMIVAKGDRDVIDVFLLNTVNLSGPQTLKLTVKRPDGSVAFTTEKRVTAAGGYTFGQLLAEGLNFKADVAGMLAIHATLTPAKGGTPVLQRDDQIEVIDVASAPLLKKNAVSEPDSEVMTTLKQVFHANPQRLADVSSATKLDAIVLASKSMKGDLAKTQAHVSKATGTKYAPLENVNQVNFTDALRRVHDDGTRLVLWPDTKRAAEAYAKALAHAKVVTFSRTVGTLNAPWFGSWYFVRSHWLLDGLPTNCAMDWRYGISAFAGPAWLHAAPKGNDPEGLLIDAPGIETFVGYGADHNPKVGVAGCLIPYGKGQIVLYYLPQMVRSLQASNFAIEKPIAQKLLDNALRRR